MTRRGAGVLAALMAGLIAAWIAPPARLAGAPAPSRGDPEVVWRLDAQGEIERVSLPDGTVARPAGTLPPLAAVMGPVAGRLHALAVAPDGKSTELLVIDPGSLEVRWRH